LLESLPTIEEALEEQSRRQQSAEVNVGAKCPSFRGAALEIQSYRGHEWILSGPAETGKTVSTLWLLDSLLRETPRANAILARKLQVSIWGTVLVTFKRIQALREAMGEEPASAYGGEKPEWYVYPNGAKLWIGGLDNPNKILSGERDWIYVNQAEELTLNDWEVLLTRCTGRGAQTKTPMLFGDCNPGAADHWILKREGLQLFHSRHVDNPTLYDDDGNMTEQGTRSLAALASLTGIRKARLCDGKWVGAEGLYFEEFDETIHVIEPFEVPADWPVWGAFDYGFAHPTAFGLFTEDNDGVIYILGEHVQNKWLPPLHCRAIRELMKICKVHPDRVRQIVAGHDCFNQRGSSDGKTIAEQYQDALDPENGEPIGLTMERADNDRLNGAAEMLGRLGNAELEIKPTLYFVSRCTRTISAMTRMVHDPHRPEDVLKVNADQNGEGGDDAYDCARYGVMARASTITVIC
jgi:hypothetical protein